MSSDLARSKLEQLKKKVSQLKGIRITNISIFGITYDHVISVYVVCVCDVIHKPEDCSVTASQVAAYLAAYCVDVCH